MSLPAKTRKKWAWQLGCGVLFVLGVVFAIPLIDVFLDLRREGFLDEAKKKEYEGTSMENLKALYQATQLYYEANEVMPGAEAWMDELTMYVKTADLKKGEAMKKFVNPRVPAGDGVFGYGYNSALSGAWKENIEEPSLTALIFESMDTDWNAHGDPVLLQPVPELSGGNKLVTADGSAVTLDDLLRKLEDE